MLLLLQVQPNKLSVEDYETTDTEHQRYSPVAECRALAKTSLSLYSPRTNKLPYWQASLTYSGLSTHFVFIILLILQQC